jgi:dihydroorotase
MGMSLSEAIAAVTCNPARVLQAEANLGTLTAGTIADITVLSWQDTPQTYCDALGESFTVPNQLIPTWVVKAGEILQPHRRLVRDLVPTVSV